MEESLSNASSSKWGKVLHLRPFQRHSEPAEVARGPATGAAEQFKREAMPHLNDLLRTAARVLGDRTRAEDVLQEVYLEAWKSFHRFEPGTNCRAWLFQILFHRIHHYRRKWFRLALFKQGDQLVAETLPYTPPVAERLTDEEILSALDRVPEDFRAVVLLVDVEEFSYKEAAGILDIPIGTVMSRLSRGRRLLRKQLAEVAESYGIGKGKSKGKHA